MSETETPSGPEAESEEQPQQPQPPPDPNAVLMASFTEWIQTVWEEPVICPICKTTKWTTGLAVDLPIRYSAGRALTAIPVQCNNCHYTIFFNAVSAGLFNPDGTPKGPSQAEQSEADTQ